MCHKEVGKGGCEKTPIVESEGEEFISHEGGRGEVDEGAD